MKKLVLISFLGILLILAGCGSGNVKEALSTNENYLSFKNSNVDVKEKTEKIAAEDFDKLQLGKFCLANVQEGKYFKHQLISGSRSQVFILDEDANVVCSYQINDNDVMLCDERQCYEKRAFLLNQINSNSGVKDRNVALKGNMALKFNMKVNGKDFFEYLNDEQAGTGDLTKMMFESVFPPEPIYMEYYEMGNKVRMESDYEIKLLNISKFMVINDGMQNTLCLEKQGKDRYCGAMEESEYLSESDMEYYTEKFNDNLLNNEKLNVQYTNPEKGEHCLKVTADDYNSVMDIYELSSNLDKIMQLSQSAKELGENLEKFEYSTELCMQGDIVTDMEMVMTMIASEGSESFVMSFEVGRDIQNVEWGAVTDANFEIPEGAITECQESCEDKKCYESACNVFSEFKCAYLPIENCCGNDFCESGETYSNCQIDCKGLADGIKNRDYKNFFPATLRQGGYVISSWSQFGNAGAIITENEYLIGRYDIAGTDTMVARIEVYKGDTAKFNTAKENNVGYVNELVYYEGYNIRWLNWRDVKVLLGSKDLTHRCGEKAPNGETYTGGRAAIPIDSESTSIGFTFYACLTPALMEDFISNWLSWLAEPDTKSTITVKNI